MNRVGIYETTRESLWISQQAKVVCLLNILPT